MAQVKWEGRLTRMGKDLTTFRAATSRPERKGPAGRQGVGNGSSG